jgi:hypothetical protein
MSNFFRNVVGVSGPALIAAAANLGCGGAPSVALEEPATAIEASTPAPEAAAAPVYYDAGQPLGPQEAGKAPEYLDTGVSAPEASSKDSAQEAEAAVLKGGYVCPIGGGIQCDNGGSSGWGYEVAPSARGNPIPWYCQHAAMPERMDLLGEGERRSGDGGVPLGRRISLHLAASQDICCVCLRT